VVVRRAGDRRHEPGVFGATAFALVAAPTSCSSPGPVAATPTPSIDEGRAPPGSFDQELRRLGEPRVSGSDEHEVRQSRGHVQQPPDPLPSAQKARYRCVCRLLVSACVRDVPGQGEPSEQRFVIAGGVGVVEDEAGIGVRPVEVGPCQCDSSPCPAARRASTRQWPRSLGPSRRCGMRSPRGGQGSPDIVQLPHGDCTDNRHNIVAMRKGTFPTVRSRVSASSGIRSANRDGGFTARHSTSPRGA
jgi:hypothetical protein